LRITTSSKFSFALAGQAVSVIWLAQGAVKLKLKAQFV
jgi:hypothetical protein